LIDRNFNQGKILSFNCFFFLF